MRAWVAIALATVALAAGAGNASAAQSRAAEEAAFLNGVDRNETANAMTGDVPYFTGSKIKLRFTVEAIVGPGVMVAQCGKRSNRSTSTCAPRTEHRHAGDVLRVLRVVDTLFWTDLMGHTVYYPIVNARFVDVIASH